MENKIVLTYDDLPEDIRSLIDMGVYTEEEAIDKCVKWFGGEINGSN